MYAQGHTHTYIAHSLQHKSCYLCSLISKFHKMCCNGMVEWVNFLPLYIHQVTVSNTGVSYMYIHTYILVDHYAVSVLVQTGAWIYMHKTTL